MTIETINITKLTIIIIVGISAIMAIYLNMQDIPALCLGGLIGYLSKDIKNPNNDETEIIEQ